MVDSGRYDTTGMAEDQYEPGSDGAVLWNLMGIKSRVEMGVVETTELLRVTEGLLETVEADHQFTAMDICDMHRSGWARFIPGQVAIVR